MRDKLAVSVITATYNESSNIEEFIERTQNSLRYENFELIIVDDNSPDGTAKIAQKYAEIYGNIRVIVRKRKMGLASALLRGIEESKGEILVIIDADLQHPPEFIQQLVEKLKEDKSIDLAVASRYLGNARIEGWSLKRKIVSKGAIFLAHLLIPQARKTTDPISGFFALKKQVINDREREITPRGFKILLEILVKCPCKKVVDIPYAFKSREAGKSKLSIKDILNYAFQLLSLTAYNIKHSLHKLTYALVATSYDGLAPQ